MTSWVKVPKTGGRAGVHTLDSVQLRPAEIASKPSSQRAAAVAIRGAGKGDSNGLNLPRGRRRSHSGDQTLDLPKYPLVHHQEERLLGMQ